MQLLVTKKQNVSTRKSHGYKLIDMKTPQEAVAEDVAVSADDTIYVTDQNTESVLVFNKQGVKTNIIPVGTKGDSCIALTAKNMYVTSKGDNKVYRLDLRRVTTKTFVCLKESGGLNTPYFVGASQTHVAVGSQHSYKVNMYEGGVYSYECKWRFPWGLTIDSAGRLFVCDNENNRVSIVSVNGSHLSYIHLRKNALSSPSVITINNHGQLVDICGTTCVVYE